MYTKNGETVMDTVRTWPVGTPAASASTMNEVLTYIYEQYPSDRYGMVFSSHATGWLPTGYYSAHLQTYSTSSVTGSDTSTDEESIFPKEVPGPAVKTIGQEYKNNKTVSLEIEIEDFAAAIPMHFDYILFDACLMGGIETAYALKDICDEVGFSQAEVLAQGFDYTTLTTRLLKPSVPEPETVCSDYYAQYENQSGVYKSATISLVDCSKLDTLGSVCNTIFDEYRDEIAAVDPSAVQGFFRFNEHWFYDMEDIVEQAGIADADLLTLQNAISDCIVYKAATPSFMNTFAINKFCGLTMYLPANGNTELDEFYSTLSWNNASGLVE
jgi:hypothetical protein